MIKKSNNFTGPFLAAFIFVKLVLEPLSGSVFMSCCISMLPLSYRHPKGKVDLNYDFIQPHSPSSICDRTVAGDEGPNGDEIHLKQVPEGWMWVIVLVSGDGGVVLFEDFFP